MNRNPTTFLLVTLAIGIVAVFSWSKPVTVRAKSPLPATLQQSILIGGLTGRGAQTLSVATANTPASWFNYGQLPFFPKGLVRPAITAFRTEGVAWGPRLGNDWYGAGGSYRGDSTLSIIEGYPVKLFVLTSTELNRHQGYENYINRKLAERMPSHVFDDKWYAWRVAPGESLILLAVRGELREDKTANFSKYFYACAYAYNGKSWEIHGCSNSTGRSLPNDQKHQVNAFGKAVQFDFFNPKNENGWTGNDIWYSFDPNAD